MRKIEISAATINNNKNRRKAKIALLSDIHFSSNLKNSELDKILEKIASEKPNYIFLAGDIIDSVLDIKEDKQMERLEKFLKSLTEVAKTFMCLGNHDMSITMNNKQIEASISFYIKKLEKIKNFYILNNKSFEDQKIFVYGYTRPFKTYFPPTDRVAKVDYKVPQNKFSILLTHSPQKLVSNFDLTLTGHMHNGLIPPILDKIFKGNYGIIGPKKTFFPEDARGIIKTKDGIIVISGGVTKIGKTSPKCLWWLNNLYPISINIININ